MRYKGYKLHYWLRNFYTLRRHIISCQYLIDNLKFTRRCRYGNWYRVPQTSDFFPNSLNLHEYKYMYVGSVQNSLLREPTDSLRLRQLASLRTLILRKEGRIKPLTMDEIGVHNPLLSSQPSRRAFVRKIPLFVTLAKWILKIIMWVLFISWVVFIFLFPLGSVQTLFGDWIAATDRTLFGTTGLLAGI